MIVQLFLHPFAQYRRCVSLMALGLLCTISDIALTAEEAASTGDVNKADAHVVLAENGAKDQSHHQSERYKLLTEAEAQIALKRYAEAEAIISTFLEIDENDSWARALRYKIDIAKQQGEIRSVIDEQSQRRDEILAEPQYHELKAKQHSDIQRQLEVIEILITQEELERAVALSNAILLDNPHNLAVLHIKHKLLNKIHDRERRRLDEEKGIFRKEVANDITKRSIHRDQPKLMPRTVLYFDEDIAEQERERTRKLLATVVAELEADKLPVDTVLKRLFAVAGINYFIVDQAIGSETVTLQIQNESVEQILRTLQHMVPIHFNYRGGSVYVTSNESPVLITEIYRLKSGLTDVTSAPALTTSFSSSSYGSSNGTSAGNADAQSIGDSFAAGGEGIAGSESGGEGATDLERFMERIAELVPWPDGSTWYLDRKSSTLYLRSTPSSVAEVKRLLHALDYSSEQVLIEARFVEVSDTAMHNLGVNWQLIGEQSQNNGNFLLGVSHGTSVSPLVLGTEAGAASFAQTLGGAGLSISAGGVGRSIFPNFSAQIQALEEKGEANTLSEPKILTLSNSTGVIDIRRQISYISGYQNIGVSNTVVVNNGGDTSSNASSNALVPEFSTVNAGIQLRVTPSVARNTDVITLDIQPTVADVVISDTNFAVSLGDAVVNQVIQQPQISARQLATRLHIKNGQTIVMGGLIAESESDSQSGVPGLKNIPGFGGLFRTDSGNSQRSKLLVFVTAHIIDPTGNKFNDEVRHLRDTAQIILPPEILEAERERRREEQFEALRAVRDRRDPQPVSDSVDRSRINADPAGE